MKGGLTIEQMEFLAAKGLDAADMIALAKMGGAKSKGAERTARWRARKQGNVTSDVTRDASHPPYEVSTPPVSSDEETKPAPKSKPTSPAKPDGVSDPTWRDFQAHRRAKKAPITETALTAIGREAAQAGWTMEAALTEIVARDWRGFKAEWVAGPRGPPNGAANDGGSYLDHIVAQQRNRAAAEPTH